jgi:fumarate hydratase class II
MMPVMAYEVLESIRIMTAAVRLFTERCVVGITANVERCTTMIEQSLAMCTALAPVIGYDAAAAIAKESHATGKTVREIARERRVLPEDTLARILDPMRQTEPGIPE